MVKCIHPGCSSGRHKLTPPGYYPEIIHTNYKLGVDVCYLKEKLTIK